MPVTKDDVRKAVAVLIQWREQQFRTPKVCLQCGKEFLGLPNQHYCSDRCGYRYRAKMRRRRLKAAKEGEGSDAGNKNEVPQTGHCRGE